MKPLQEITIQKHENGGFTFSHKHRDFSFESYLASSAKGLLNAIENIIGGFQPDPADLYIKNSDELKIHTGAWKHPKPLG